MDFSYFNAIPKTLNESAKLWKISVKIVVPDSIQSNCGTLELKDTLDFVIKSSITVS